MFTSWLFEQQDRDDRVGLIAKTAFADFNAGCASLFPTAVGWKKHFESNHVKRFDFLLELLGDAFVEYSQLDK